MQGDSPAFRSFLLALAAAAVPLPAFPAPEAEKPAAGFSGAEVEAPVLTDENARVFTFVIPAPRGLITDRDGRPLAATRAATRCAIRLASFGPENLSYEDISDSVREALGRLNEALPEVSLPSGQSLKSHWEHRRAIPMPFGKALTEEEETAFAEFAKGTAFVRETFYLREYPAGPDTAHVAGYVNSDRPDQHGPLADEEPRWPRTTGTAGLESSFDEALRGTDGIVSEIFDSSGRLKERQVIEPALPGQTLVTSVSLPMQQLACRVLRESRRAGAFVVADATTGDLLVLATRPSFDPAELSRGIGAECYREMADRPDHPFFNRPVSGAYPPGSLFKPMVALAALDRGVINGLATRFAGPPQIEIDGRAFRNWNDRNEGPLDVRFALLRSCNTWFYQAGIYTGGNAIRSVAETFGFGRAPDIPLESVAQGALPASRKLSARQAVANFSIGQGDLLISPLQAALAMSGLANEHFVPEARLILQRQDPMGRLVTRYDAPRQRTMINFHSYDLGLVRAGMWGVVNHQRGTGRAAALDDRAVYGKTGTAQWAAGETERSLAWFGGYMPVKDGVIAFVVMTEGARGESLSGGKTAAPMAGEFLKSLVSDPGKYGISLPARRTNPRLTGLPQPAARVNPVASRTQQGQVPARRANDGYASSSYPALKRYQPAAPRDGRHPRPPVGDDGWETWGERAPEEVSPRQYPGRKWEDPNRRGREPGTSPDERPGLIRRFLNIFD